MKNTVLGDFTGLVLVVIEESKSRLSAEEHLLLMQRTQA